MVDLEYKPDKQFVIDERKRIRALETSDALTYFNLCNKHGLTPENEELYTVGQVESGVLSKRKRVPTKKVSNIERIARVALRPFSLCAIGEVVHDKEIRRKLKNIREAGYPVEPYSRKTKREVSRYLESIRREISRRLQRENPGLIREIREENERLQRGY